MLKQIAKAAQYDLAVAFHTRNEHFKAWLHNKVEEQLVLFFQWAFSKNAVQRAVAQTITCDTPIGRMLNSHIDDAVEHGRSEGIDADDVQGLERYVEETVERAISDFSDNSLEDAVMEAIDIDKVAERVSENSDFQEECTKAVLEEMVSRLKK